MMNEFQLQMIQVLIAALGPPLTLIGLYFMLRDVRSREKAVTVQEQSTLAAATKDEFSIMDMVQKQQNAMIMDLRASNSELKKSFFDGALENAQAVEAIKNDFKRQMTERDEQRKAELETVNKEMDRLRGDLSKSQDRIKELEDQLKAANDEIRLTKGKLELITRELEEEREKNAKLTARIMELETRQHAADEANHKSDVPLSETKDEDKKATP